MERSRRPDRASRRRSCRTALRATRAALRQALAALLLVGAASSAAALPFGVNAHIPGPAELDAIRAAGIEWARVDFIWAWIEPSPGVFDWSIYDRLVANAEARGVKLYAGIGTTPAWATDGAPETGPPRDALAWYDVCYRAASRYRGRIGAWAMWNEPNLTRFWTGSRRQYIDLILIPGSRAVHTADPGALVAGPDLAHLNSGDWDRWLGDVIHDAGDSLDVLSHHVYPSDGSPGSVVDALNSGTPGPFGSPSVRRVLQDAGWGGRPVWLTETGVEASLGDYLAELRQARFVSGLHYLLFSASRQVDWVDKVFVYELTGTAWGITRPLPDLVPREAYLVLRDFIAQNPVSDATFVTPPRRTVTVAPGKALPLAITVRNAGSTTWTAAAGVTLRVSGDAAPFGAVDLALAAGESVRPGATRTFAASLAAPGVAGRYQLAFRMAGTTAFGDEAHLAVDVTSAPPPRVAFVPAVANADGRNLTRWRTDLSLYNPADRTAEVEVAFLESGGDNTWPRTATVSVPARSGANVVNVLATLFGSSGTGALRLTTPAPDLLMQARTFTLAGGGTCGQSVPILAPGSAAPSGRDVTLVALRRAADDVSGFRTNVGLVNVQGFAIAVTADFSDGGRALGRIVVDLEPYGTVQLNDVFRRLTSNAVTDAVATLRTTTADGAFLAYASIVDNASGDPTIVLPAAAVAEPVLLPAVAHGPGVGSTVWRSDLDLFNPAAQPATFSAAFVPAGGGPAPPPRRFSLAPGAALHLSDAAAAELGGSGPGAIRIDPLAGSLCARGRTYNLTAGGTFGQEVPAVPTSAAAAAGQRVTLLGLSAAASQRRGFRTNIGFLNVSALPITVSVELYRVPARDSATRTFDLAPGEWRQVTDIFASAPSAVDEGYAILSTATPGGRFIAWASVVDNVTGDPTYVAPQ